MFSGETHKGKLGKDGEAGTAMFSMCCKYGMVKAPKIKDPPEVLKEHCLATLLIARSSEQTSEATTTSYPLLPRESLAPSTRTDQAELEAPHCTR